VIGLIAGGLLMFGELSRRVALLGAALAVVVALAGPGAYSLATAAVPHTGAIPSAGPSSTGGPGGFGGGPGGRGGGGIGGLLNATTPGTNVINLLSANASHYTWVAATVGSNNAAGYQLATRDPVMAIGGFNGTDPAPSLAQFEQYVSEGKIHYYIASSGGGFGGGGGAGSSSDDASAITSWVESHFTAKTVGGVTVYDLTSRTK
jgi:hypothetical protein